MVGLDVTPLQQVQLMIRFWGEVVTMFFKAVVVTIFFTDMRVMMN